jgi:hypothetical protein
MVADQDSVHILPDTLGVNREPLASCRPASLQRHRVDCWGSVQIIEVLSLAGPALLRGDLHLHTASLLQPPRHSHLDGFRGILLHVGGSAPDFHMQDFIAPVLALCEAIPCDAEDITPLQWA